MATCLTTTLRDSATGKGLKGAEEIRLHVKQQDSIEFANRFIALTFLEPSVVKATGSGYFMDASSSSLGNSVSFSANNGKTLYLSNNADYDVVISNKYALSVFQTTESVLQFTEFMSLDLEDLCYLPSLARFIYCQKKLEGDARFFKGLAGLTYLNISRTPAPFDLEVFAECTSLRSLTLSYTGTYGDISSLAPLEDLTLLSLGGCAGVYGDIGVLQHMPNLVTFNGPQVQSPCLSGSLGDIGSHSVLRVFQVGSEPNIEGALDAFDGFSALTTFSLQQNSKVTGSIANFASSVYLSSFTLSSCPSVSGSIAVFENMPDLATLYLADSYGITGNLSSLAELTGLAIVNLNNTGVSGDIDSFSDMTSMTSLSLMGAHDVSGSISSLADLTGLTLLNIQDTQVSGNVSGLSGMTGLTSLTLSGTPVSGDIGAATQNCSGLTAIYANRCKNLSGDLAKLPSRCTYFEATASGQYTWEASRSASSSIVAIVNANLGSYVDAMLIAQAACTDLGGASRSIMVYGVRTSASNSAVATLNSKGFSVYVNGVLVSV